MEDKTRFTPGPWAFHPGDLVIFDTAVRFGVARILPCDYDPAVDQANAYIVAAAPTMFDALLAAEQQLAASAPFSRALTVVRRALEEASC
jgi:hypothetical protein